MCQYSMNDKKPYIIVVVVMQFLNSVSFILSKAAFDAGSSPPVFLFYRQAVASLLLVPFAIVTKWGNSPQLSVVVLLKIFMIALLGVTVAYNLYYIGLKYTSETVLGAISNAMPIQTFILALLLRMETLKLSSSHGVAKGIGVALSLCGVIIVALYAGLAISPLNHHQLFYQSRQQPVPSSETWIKGTFFLLISTISWSLWLTLQVLFKSQI